MRHFKKYRELINKGWKDENNNVMELCQSGFMKHGDMDATDENWSKCSQKAFLDWWKSKGVDCQTLTCKFIHIFCSQQRCQP